MTSLNVTLQRDDSGPVKARGVIRGMAEGFSDQRLDDALLATTELFTNALQHGLGEIRLTVSRKRDRLRVEVLDQGGGFPNELGGEMTPTGNEGGFGLRIVDRVVDRWGAQEDTALVWFEMDVAGAPV